MKEMAVLEGGLFENVPYCGLSWTSLSLGLEGQ